MERYQNVNINMRDAGGMENGNDGIGELLEDLN